MIGLGRIRLDDYITQIPDAPDDDELQWTPVLEEEHLVVEERKRAVVIVSGGMDSVTLAHLVASEGYDLQLLSFDYGQRHSKELDFARLCAMRLNAEWEIIDLKSVTRLLKGSALTDPSVAVPHGHYAADNMRITVVPNRNAMMLSIAYAVAVAQDALMVAAGFHAGDHSIYPDCRPKFVRRFYKMERTANEGFINPHLKLRTPFIELGKHDIVAIGSQLGVPYELTWSCYEGGELHCGRCGTCVERKEAFRLAKVNDPTFYVDKYFEVIQYVSID